MQQNPGYLKSRFVTGAKPSQTDFTDLIDSMDWATTETSQKAKGAWYVSSSPSISDHGQLTQGAAAWCVGQDTTEVVFPGDASYAFTSSWTPSGKHLRFGANVLLSVSSGKTVDLSGCTLSGPLPLVGGAGMVVFGVGALQYGLLLRNADGTLTKKVRLNDTGDGLVFETP